MDLYLQVLNTRVFEDVDKIYISDYSFMQMFGMAFGNNWGFGDTSAIKQLREQIEKSDEKEEQAIIV